MLDGIMDTQRALAFAVILAFVGVIILLIFHPLSNDSPATAIVNTLVGVLGSMATAIVTYYFGSSKGSTDKDSARDRTLDTLVSKVVTNGKPMELKS